MKRKQRKLTKFGKALKVSLEAAILLLFGLLLSFTGVCELGDSVSSYILHGSVVIVLLGAVVYIYNKIFE